jgi:molybdopterin-containing oxidoreductase family membrane subunit
MDGLLAAVRSLKEHGLEIADVYSPVHEAELVRLWSPRPSPLRVVTLAGGVAGLAAGLGLALLTTAVWELVVDGKPYYSLVPYLVVGFEFTILIGALFTVAGLLLFARLPHFGFPTRAYRPEFSVDRFGVWVTGPDQKLEEARALLQQCGALDVQDLAETEEEE